MAPNKKPAKSPFALFVTKMERQNAEVKTMPLKKKLDHCDTFYKQLAPKAKLQIKHLSDAFKLNTITEAELNGRLDALNLNGDGDQEVDHKSDFNDIAIELKFPSNGMTADEEESDSNAVFNKALIPSLKVFRNETIVVLSFNILVKTLEGEYLPLEVGLTKFSADGAIESFTKLIANQLPSGYYAKAKEFSAMFHKLPITCGHSEPFEADYRLLFYQIYDFISSSTIKDEKNRKIIFAKGENCSGISDRDQVEGCLLWFDKWMQNNDQQSGKSLTEDFIIKELSDLLHWAETKFGNPETSRKLCVDALNESTFDYSDDIRCDYHSVDDNIYCALAVAKRSALLFKQSVDAMKDKSVDKSEMLCIGIGRGRLRQNLKNLKLGLTKTIS